MLSEAQRAEAYVKAAQQFIRGDDDVAAERMIRKANELVHGVGSRLLTLRFKTVYAQILDQKRRFIEAVQRYIEILRQVTAEEVDEEDIRSILTKAAICAILAPAGPQRQRVMNTLMRDERIGTIEVRQAGVSRRLRGARSHTRCPRTSLAARRLHHVGAHVHR